VSDRPSGISSLRGSEISSRRLFGHDQGHEVICAIGSPRHTFGDKATQHICFTINNTPCTHISPSTQQNRRGSHISFGIMFFLLARDRIVSFLTGVLSSPLRLISGLFTLRIDSSHPFHILFQVSFRGVQRRRGELDLSRCSTSTRVLAGPIPRDRPPALSGTRSCQVSIPGWLLPHGPGNLSVGGEESTKGDEERKKLKTVVLWPNKVKVCLQRMRRTSILRRSCGKRKFGDAG